METGTRNVGPASLRVRRTVAVPVEMRERVREICQVEVPSPFQNRGLATTLLHKVCREADAANIVLMLWPQPFGDHISMSSAQLIAWYANEFGFVQIQPEPALMARQPGVRKMQLNPVMKAFV